MPRCDVEMMKQARRVIAGVEPDRLHMRVISEEADCGTAGCLVGHMCMDPWFRKHTAIGSVPLDGGRLALASYRDERHAIDTAADVLGLAQFDTERLFALRVNQSGNPHAITKAEVLENIDRLIRGEPAQPYAVVTQAIHVELRRRQED